MPRGCVRPARGAWIAAARKTQREALPESGRAGLRGTVGQHGTGLGERGFGNRKLFSFRTVSTTTLVVRLRVHRHGHFPIGRQHGTGKGERAGVNGKLCNY